MMKKMSKKILNSILIISLCSCLFLATPVNAFATGINQAMAWSNTNISTVINKKAIYDLLDKIYGILLIVLVVTLIFRGIFIGLKMILSTTVEERVDAKKLVVDYIKLAVGVGFGGAFIRMFLEFVWTLF